MTKFRPKVYKPDINYGHYPNEGKEFKKYDLYTMTKRRKFEELTQVAPDIWIKDFSLDKAFCKKLIGRYEEEVLITARDVQGVEKVKPGVVGGGPDGTVTVMKEIKDSSDYIINNNNDSWKQDDKLLYEELFSNSSALTKELQSIRSDNATWFDYDKPYQIQKTVPGGKYVWHTEAGPGTIDRTLTFMWYLNDDYKDGNTGFVRQGVEIEAKTGRLVLFSPYWTHIHSGLPVEEGEKYIITGWVHMQLPE